MRSLPFASVITQTTTRLTFNTFSGNGKLAVYSGYSSGNRFYLNDFVNNTAGILNTSGAIVNSTEKYVYTYSGGTNPSYLGNHNSDYNGADSDGNGIGDTPATTGDDYPLAHPIGQFTKRFSLHMQGSRASDKRMRARAHQRRTFSR